MDALGLSTTEVERLAVLETTIEKGLQTFIEVGNALMEIRDGRLYRARFGTFDEYCRDRWNIDRTYAHRLMDAAQVVNNLLPIGNVLPTNEAQARTLTKLTPQLQRTVWPIVVDTAPNGKITANHIERTVDDFLSPGLDIAAALADEDKPICPECGQVYDGDGCPDCQPPNEPMAVHYSSETDEWYTPRRIIDRVLQVLGEIDLDPCSNPQRSVPATNHYTQEDDGLSRPWFGRVYMNPPYGREIKAWVNYLHSQWTMGQITEAIALVPARTDTEWFRVLEPFPRCFIYGRLAFSDGGNNAPFPSMAVYLGDRVDVFKSAFREIGGVYRLDQ